jgi:uncharacterized membrane protein
MTLLPIHIIAGLTGIASGFIAVFALKGAKLHRKSGMIFVYAMVILALTGAVMAAIKSQPGNVIGGLISLYLVVTGVLTLRLRERFHWIDAVAIAAGLGVGLFSLKLGIDVANSPSGKINGVPPAPLFVFAAVALLAAAGDTRVWLTGSLHGAHRIARHLWRMCFALFVASGSFFLGQAQVFPKPIRIFPLLAIPALLPLVLMLYWLARVLFTNWYRRRADSFKPTMV